MFRFRVRNAKLELPSQHCHTNVPTPAALCLVVHIFGPESAKRRGVAAALIHRRWRRRSLFMRIAPPYIPYSRQHQVCISERTNLPPCYIWLMFPIRVCPCLWPCSRAGVMWVNILVSWVWFLCDKVTRFFGSSFTTIVIVRYFWSRYFN